MLKHNKATAVIIDILNHRPVVRESAGRLVLVKTPPTIRYRMWALRPGQERRPEI
jgi:hypothetical protein